MLLCYLFTSLYLSVRESIDDKSVGGWVIAHASQQMSRLDFQLLPLQLKKATSGQSAKCRAMLTEQAVEMLELLLLLVMTVDSSDRWPRCCCCW